MQRISYRQIMKFTMTLFMVISLLVMANPPAFCQPCQPDTAKPIDQPAVGIWIGFTGQAPQKAGDTGMAAIILTPNGDFDDLLLSINATSGAELTPRGDFTRGDPVTPFIDFLSAGDNFNIRLSGVDEGQPDTFYVSVRFTQPGQGYILASLRSPATGRNISFAESSILYFYLKTSKAFFSYHSIMDLDVQSLSDSLAEEGVSKEAIDKAVKKLKRSGAKVKIRTAPDTVKPNKGSGGGNTDEIMESYNSIIVQGTVSFTDVNGGTHPVRFVTVQIMDEESGAADELVATTSTDNNGFYTATVDANDGDGTTRDIYVVVRAEGTAVQMEDDAAPFDVWEIDSGDAQDDVPDGTTLTIDVTATNNDASPQNVVFEAYEAINYVAQYLVTLGEPLPALLSVRYPGAGDGSSFSPPGGPLNLAGTDVHDWDNIMHEYSHYIQEIYGITDNPGGYHYFNANMCDYRPRNEIIPLVWGEAWPTFFGTMVQMEENLGTLGIQDVGDTRYSDRKPNPADDIDYDLEALNAWSMGEDNEISIQRALWDIYDNVDDGGDVGVSMSPQDIWDFIADNQPVTFSEFWNYMMLDLTDAEMIQMGGILADQNIGTDLTAPANGTSYSGGALPTFQWDGNLECATAGNERYSVQFYNDALTAMIWSSPWQNGTSFTPTADQGDYIFVGPDGTLRWVVASRNLTAPQTGDYYGNSRTIVDDYDVPDRNPVDIILALDISGSMNSPAPASITGIKKIELLQQAVEIFVRTWGFHAITGDRMGVVYFSTNISTMAAVPPFLKDLASNVDAIVGDVLGKSPLSCTAIGGALQVAYDNFDATSTNKKVIILFSDGEQTANPMIVEQGSPSRLQVESLASGATVPFGGYWCSSSDATDYNGSAVVPDGQALEDHDIEIHTIGVGPAGATFEGLISRIASETDAVHHFTHDPDADLDIFFTNDLINSLKTGTLEIVETDQGLIEQGSSKYVTVPVNPVAISLTLVLSWKGEMRVEALTMNVTAPNGVAVSPTSMKKGDFYSIYYYDLPLSDDGDSLTHWGNWGVRIESDVDTDDVYYQFSAIVDEPCFHYYVDFPRKLYVAGDPVTFMATITQNNKPLPNGDGIWVDVTSPAKSVGNILSYCLPRLSPKAVRKYKRDPAGELYPRKIDALMATFLDDDDNANLVKAKKTTRVKLYDNGQNGDRKVGDGIYTNIMTGTLIPGNYQFRFQLTGSSLCGRVKRTELNSTYISVGSISDANSIVRAFAVTDRIYNITVRPADNYGNLLGPGFDYQVQILSSSGNLIGPVRDRFDGSYDQVIAINEDPDPTITVQVKGDHVYRLRLSDLVRLGTDDPAPVPRISGISPKSGKPGETLDLIITGSNFDNWADVIFNNNGIIVEDLYVASGNQINSTIHINENTASDAVDVIVVNPGGKGSAAEGAFTILGDEPIVTADRAKALSWHVGLAVPHGDFDDLFDPSISFALDFEFKLKPHLYLEPLVGYHHFHGDTVASTYWANVSANLKYYFRMADYSLFLNSGPGWYFPERGKSYAGANAGFGIKYPLTRAVSIAGSYNFHTIFTEDTNTNFSTLWLGWIVDL